ncbi:SAM-dependent methyltransferase [Marinitenerispora sediminis]|uniref:SAM-dependent methyltransferase n=1 Tax=Marinitenerispora sediminis TaxID=1931232 RepID=UPI0013147199|nr:SAM-dependent methyltransferase [Marinitenerispora sediminis]
MTDDRRARHIEHDPPALDVPLPRVIRVEDYLRRSGRERPPTEGRPPENTRLRQAKRGFLWRAVSHFAADLRIAQFVDVGSRLPVADGIHHAARQYVSDARVVYVDTDSAVSLHGRASSCTRTVPVVRAAGERPEAVVAALGARGLVDYAEPVAVLMVEPDAVRAAGLVPEELVRAFHAAMCPGGRIAIAQRRVTGERPGSGPVHPAGAVPDAWAREHAAALFGPFPLVEPGLADMAWWPYPDEEVTATGVGVLAGVGRRV